MMPRKPRLRKKKKRPAKKIFWQSMKKQSANNYQMVFPELSIK